jgi:DNA gyrase/topoisomerase IV subunit A
MGTAKIVFTVTANGGDIYIPTSDNNTSTITARINNSTSITNDAWICTNATEDTTNKFWRIVSGNTATCEYNGVFTTSTAGYYYVNIYSIKWNTSATSTGAVTQTWGIDTLKTGQTYLSGN